MPPIIQTSVKRLDCTLWSTNFACFGVSPLHCNFNALFPAVSMDIRLLFFIKSGKKLRKGPFSINYNYIRQEHRGGTVLNFKLV